MKLRSEYIWIPAVLFSMILLTALALLVYNRPISEIEAGKRIRNEGGVLITGDTTQVFLTNCRDINKCVFPINSLRKLDKLDVSLTPANDEFLAKLAEPNRVQFLYARDSYVGGSNLSRFEKVSLLDLKWCPLHPTCMKEIAKIRTLETVDLSYTNVSDNDISVLAQSTSIRNLYLQCTAITDNAVAKLCKLDSLKGLSLSDTKVTNKSVELISESNLDLAELHLEGTQVNGKSLNLLSSQNLKKLGISNCRFDSFSFERHFPNVEHLWVNDSEIDTDTMAAISKMKNLRVLAIQICQMDNMSLIALGRSKSLTLLYLVDCDLNASQTIKEIESNNPYLTIQVIEY